MQIIDKQRLVVLEQLRLDDELRTASIVAWELTEVDEGVRVDYTEQYLVLLLTGDGSADQAERKGAVPMMLRGFAIAVQERT